VDDDERLRQTRASWNTATAQHNAHKRDQAAFLRAGGSTLFPEEIALAGDVAGARFLHLLCNAGQDSLSFAARGAIVTGVDLSDEAIAFARGLSDDAGIAATFVQGEAIDALERDDGPLRDARFDVAFCSYGALPWIRDLPRFFRGVARRLVDGGRFVCVEFHPLAWSFDAQWQRADPYFAPGRAFTEPVTDYVGQSGGALAPSGFVDVALPPNKTPAHAFQHTVADVVQGLVDAGLAIEALREWPYSNGCRVHEGLVDVGANRFAAPPGPRGEWNLPLMLGVAARRGAP
jgi:SAM-dependent methyltransferase